MSFDEIMNQLASSNYLYLVIAACATLIVFIAITSSKKKRISDRIAKAQVKINNLNSHSFTVDIAKMEAITRVNESFRDTADSCKKDFNQIQEILKNAVSSLQDCSECMGIGKFKKCDEILKEIEPALNEGEEISTRLKDVLNTILNQSSMQRIRINELKSEFHDIKAIVNEHYNDYTYCWVALDKTTNHISHLFTEFEQIMDASKYEEAAKKASEIEKNIDSLNLLVSNLPSLISLARDNIPAQMNQLNAAYKVACEYDTCLQNLNFDNTVAKLMSDITECMNNLKECKIEGINERLIEIQSRINAMQIAIEDEKNAYKQLLRVKADCEEILKKVSSSIERMDKDQNNVFRRYNMNAMAESYAALKTKYNTVQQSYDVLLSTYENRSIPSTTLLMTFNEILNDVNELNENCLQVVGSVDENNLQEGRVRELISRFMVVLNESKENIRLSHLPNISSKYRKDIQEAEDRIAQINALLNENVLDMDAIRIKADQAQSLVTTLYQNANKIIETANEIESFIVLCNKYRPYYPDVDSALYLAELAYRNGEYTKACKLSAAALEKIDPKKAHTLMSSIERKLQSAKEA